MSEAGLDTKWKVAIAAAAVIGTGAAIYYLTKEQEKEQDKLQDETVERAPVAAEEPVAAAPAAAAATPTSTSGDAAEEKAKALKAKTSGNDAFKEKNYARAVENYTKAIQLYPGEGGDELAFIYTNRAAAFLYQEKYGKVIEDCTAALDMKPSTKAKKRAYQRRGKAYEQEKDLKCAAHDYMALQILEGPQSKSSASQDAERLLKVLAQKEAEKLRVNRNPRLPSKSTLLPFLDGFSQDIPHEADSVAALTKKINENQTDGTLYLRRARASFASHKFDDVFDDAVRAADKLRDENAIPALVEALTLKGMFHHLRDELEEAHGTFAEAAELDPGCVDVLVKRALVYIEEGKLKESEDEFKKAYKIGPDSPSVLYHRGQLLLRTNQVIGAQDDFKTSIKKGHKGYAPYLQLSQTQRDIEAALKVLDDAAAKFPTAAVIFIYKGQFMERTGQVEKASEAYDFAHKVEPSNSMPLIHKGLMMMQSNVVEGVKLLEQAVSVEPDCFPALQQLGHIAMQMKDYKKASEWFDKMLEVARQSQELESACIFKESVLLLQQLASEGLSP